MGEGLSWDSLIFSRRNVKVSLSRWVSALGTSAVASVTTPHSRRVAPEEPGVGCRRMEWAPRSRAGGWRVASRGGVYQVLTRTQKPAQTTLWMFAQQRAPGLSPGSNQE